MECSIARMVAVWLCNGKRMGAAIALTARHFGMRFADVEEIVERWS